MALLLIQFKTPYPAGNWKVGDEILATEAELKQAGLKYGVDWIPRGTNNRAGYTSALAPVLEAQAAAAAAAQQAAQAAAAKEAAEQGAVAADQAKLAADQAAEKQN